MNKYIINGVITGYQQMIMDEKINDIKDSAVVLYIDQNFDNESTVYYNGANKLLQNRNRLYLVGTMDECKTFISIASLMLLYNNYDIYTVANKTLMTKEYVDNILERQPDYQEAITYIGGDVVSYSNLSNVLFGLESIIDEGESEKIKKYIEDNLGVFENMTHTINQMKKTADMFNSDELVSDIKDIKNEKSKIEDKLASTEEEVKNIKHENEEQKIIIETLKRDYNKIKETAKVPVVGISDENDILSRYNEIKMQNIKYTVKAVLYFKEISYVRYTNTLMKQLMEYFRFKELNAKLIVYDNKTELSAVYKPLNCISGSTYNAHKETMLSRDKKEVIVGEPGISLLNDVLTQSKDPCDIVIVYDRAGFKDDIVSGNNVSRFFVINSEKEYRELQKVLGIKDIKNVITAEGSTIGKRGSNNEVTKDTLAKATEYIYIPTIQMYNAQTPAAKTSKYMKTLMSTEKSTIMEIIERSKLSKLIPNIK